jgi:hypothetical protein
MEEKMKSSDRELEWFPIKKLPRNTSFATRDFLEDYAPSKKHQTRPIYQGGGVAA